MKTITLLPFMVLVLFGCAAGDIADLSAEDQEAHIKDELAQMDLGDPEALYNNELADDVEGKADGRRSRPPLIKYHDPRQPGAAVLNQKINTIRELLRVYYVCLLYTSPSPRD